MRFGDYKKDEAGEAIEALLEDHPVSDLMDMLAWILQGREENMGEKYGRWIQLDGVRCSICNHKLQTTGLTSYCPNCGAKMEI